MNNLSFQSRALEAAGEGGVVITPTVRLAGRMRHLVRQKSLASGLKGWRPREVLSLNSWLNRTYLGSWPRLAPATQVQRLNLAARAVEDADPPGELAAGLGLADLLDKTFGLLARNDLLDLERPKPPEIILWRDRAVSAYRLLLSEAGLIHPANMAREVAELIRSGRIEFRERLVLAGLRPAARTEALLLDILKEKAGAVKHELPPGDVSRASAVALPDRDQEVAWVVENLLEDGAGHPHHRLGVVTTSEEIYHPMFQSSLEEVALFPADGSPLSFNVSSPRPALLHPLVRAGLLPLEFALLGERREELLALLMSPYFGAWPEKRRLMAADLVWREKNLNAGLRGLVASLKGKGGLKESLESAGGRKIEDLFAPFLSWKSATFARWAGALKAAYGALGFPVAAGEEDEVASAHLFELLQELATVLAGDRSDLKGFYLWLKKGLEKRRMAPAPEESAGFQVLGRIEALGLDFHRVYVVGMSAEEFPPRPESNPLLLPGEKRSIVETDPLGRHLLAGADFTNWLAMADEIILTRPRTVNSDPAAPSRFWPPNEREERMDLWAAPGRGWLRAGWLRNGWQGLISPRPVRTFRHEEPSPMKTSRGELYVSEMETLLACPFSYFGTALLGLAPLPRAALGLNPRDRGILIHRILRGFTRRAREEGLSPDRDFEACLALLREEVERNALNGEKDPALAVEARRLLGDREVSGLLELWLEEERLWCGKGWSWRSEEESFSNLSLPGLGTTVKGRVDRIDAGPGGSFVLWDYKTGRAPTTPEVTVKLTAPQLPLYLMAQAEGLLPFPGPGTRVGYIRLTFREGGSPRIIEPKEGWEEALSRWREFIEERGALLLAGDFRPDPLPKKSLAHNPCMYCDLPGVCGVWTVEEA